MFVKKKVKKIAKFEKRYLRVYSRHPSHNVLRKHVLLPELGVIRLGSVTPKNEKHKFEINTIEAVRNSANKLTMKKCFNHAGVKTADWWYYEGGEWININTGDSLNVDNLEFPIVLKNLFGSRGTGNYLIKNSEEYQKVIQNKTLSRYIIEKFYNYTREYRLHMSKNGCFYTCRKMLKKDTPEDKKWFRNDSNSVWILEENPSFDKPSNWADIVNEAQKARQAVGLDLGAVDVKIQSAKNSKGQTRENPDFIILEINSAPSFGEKTFEKYVSEIKKLKG